MPLTHQQTVELLFPGTTLTHYGLEPAPVAPEWVTESQEHEAVLSAECVTIFWKSGVVDVYYPAGLIKRFWPKPSIADAVKMPKNTATYTRFHGDGVVEQVINDVPYFWGPTDEQAAPNQGQPLNPRVERCEEPKAFGAFSVYDQDVRFAILPGSYLEKRSCDCSECYFELRQALYRRQNATACTCIGCCDCYVD